MLELLEDRLSGVTAALPLPPPPPPSPPPHTAAAAAAAASAAVAGDGGSVSHDPLADITPTCSPAPPAAAAAICDAVMPCDSEDAGGPPPAVAMASASDFLLRPMKGDAEPEPCSDSGMGEQTGEGAGLGCGELANSVLPLHSDSMGSAAVALTTVWRRSLSRAASPGGLLRNSQRPAGPSSLLLLLLPPPSPLPASSCIWSLMLLTEPQLGALREAASPLRP